MSQTSYVCIKQKRLGESGPAAIASLAHYYGLSLNYRDISSVLGDKRLKMDLFYLLTASRKFGFDAVPLEGDFEHLPEVPRPNIVSFRAGEQETDFNILYEIDSESALIGNLAIGEIERLNKEEFNRSWTGEAVQILPNRVEFDQVRKQLTEQRNPLLRLQRVLGISPFSVSRMLFLPAAAAAFGLVCFGFLRLNSVEEKFLFSAIGLCLILSIWSWIFTGTCKSCNQLSGDVGNMPLALMGAVFYTGLLGVGAFLSAPALLGAGLFFAVGVHLLLSVRMIKLRLLCWACAAIALSIFSAAFVSVAAGLFSMLQAGAAVSGFALTLVITNFARKLYELELQQGAYRLARSVVSESIVVAEGRVHIIVYKLKGCSLCSFYETVIRPAIEEEFGESVSIEERDASKEKTLVPLIVVMGTVNISAIGLSAEHGYDSLSKAIKAALCPNSGMLNDLGGIFLFQ